MKKYLVIILAVLMVVSSYRGAVEAVPTNTVI